MYQIYQDTGDANHIGFFRGKSTGWGHTQEDVVRFFKHKAYRIIPAEAIRSKYADTLVLMHEAETIEELKLLILLES